MERLKKRNSTRNEREWRGGKIDSKIELLLEMRKKAITSLKTILRELGVKYTEVYLREQAQINESVSTFDTISSVAFEYKIESLKVKFGIKELKQAPLPVVLELDVDEEIYTVVSIDDQHVEYFDSKNRRRFMELSHLKEKWSGKALLLDACNVSEEPNYEVNSKSESRKSRNIILRLCLIFITSAFVLYTYNNELLMSLFMLINFMGIIFSYSAIIEKYGESNVISSMICSSSSNNSCKSVLSDEGSKIFGTTLSDLAMFYFGVMFTISFFLLAMPPSNLLLSSFMLMVFLSVPVILFSIYHQFVIIRKRCRLCLLIIGLLAFETILVSTFYQDSLVSFRFDYKEFPILILGIVLPLILLSEYLKVLKEKIRNKSNYLRLAQFRRNADVIKSIIESAAEVIPLRLDLPFLELANSSAKDKLILVASPCCYPCKKALKKVAEMIEYFGENISVQLIIIDYTKENKVRLSVTETLIRNFNKNVSSIDRLKIIQELAEVENCDIGLASWMESLMIPQLLGQGLLVFKFYNSKYFSH